MKVGMIGLGKLGLPCLLAMEAVGKHQVFGYDVSDRTKEAIKSRQVSYWEAGVNDLLETSSLKVTETISELIDNCDIIFIAVQTPHEPMFEGRTPIPEARKDFDYSHLVSVALELKKSLIDSPEKNPLIVVISTVLPGTMRKEILPTLLEARKNLRFVYNPYFIAMGTTIEDFLNPEFILLGGNSKQDTKDLAKFYSFIEAEKMEMDVESAELTKVAYNTFIGFKIVFSNVIAEITEVRGGDPDLITGALSKATKRLMSSAYMRAGMGDGGGCHPRDQIAMSWLAKDALLSTDIFEYLATARDDQTRRQAELLIGTGRNANLPLAILGVSYKANSPLEIGSPARLLEHFIHEKGLEVKIFDPWIDDSYRIPSTPYAYFVGVMHQEFERLSVAPGSVVIDPWGFVKEVPESVKLIKPGRDFQK